MGRPFLKAAGAHRKRKTRMLRRKGDPATRSTLALRRHVAPDARSS
jgi:hypothetical protein